jgi:hypothetical protein
MRSLLAAGLPVIAVQYKHVSMRLCSVIPSADDVAAAVVSQLDKLGVGEVSRGGLRLRTCRMRGPWL